ncbi:MAG: hypothetical protein K8L99_06575 [Anaerolineae bacterium]|nr:hypothetical protein [Anaerolineae bacterium]
MLSKLYYALVSLGLLLVIIGLVMEPEKITPLIASLLIVLAVAINVLYIGIQADLRGRSSQRQKKA